MNRRRSSLLRERHLPLLAALVLALTAFAGCGGDEPSGEDPTTTTTTTPVSEPTESVDALPRLPKGWDPVINRGAGLAIGKPPRWSDRRAARGQGVLLRSPDELVSIVVTADRTRGALALPLDEFATRTADALDSEIAGDDRFEDLKIGKPAPFDHTYDAAAVRATGTPASTGVAERVLVVAVRRPDLAAFVAVVRENAERDSKFTDRDTVKRVIRTLRSRPPA